MFLGIDIGTSAVKAATFDENGREIAVASSPLTLSTPRPGWAEQHPQSWWRATCVAVREIAGAVGAASIDAVGVAGQSWAAALVDAQGDALCPTPIWMDQRAFGQAARLRQSVGKSAFRLSGNPIQPGYTTPKIVWYRDEAPQALARAKAVLQSNGFIVYRLTGELTQDVSQGYGLHCFDIAARAWDGAMARALGVNPALLPPLFPCHQVVGKVDARAAQETGLKQGTPVVAGGLDAACAALGAGVALPGQTQEQGGQAGGMGLCVDRPAMDERLILSCHVAPGLWLLQGGTVGGGGALKWLRDALDMQGDGRAFDTLCEGAARVAPGSGGVVFLPYLSGERSPLWDPDARGCFFGLSFGTGRDHLARAVLEGVAFSLRHNIETAMQAGANVGILHAMGGAARSHVWTQIKADITARTIRVPLGDNATALGAAMLAGVGVGMWPDARSAAERCVRFEREHEPEPESFAAYQDAYRIYRMLYPALRGIGAGGGSHG